MSKVGKAIALSFGGALLLLAKLAIAANIVTPAASACQVAHGSFESQIVFDSDGNGAMITPDSNAFIICGIPRSPLSPDASSAVFYVDGIGEGTVFAIATTFSGLIRSVRSITISGTFDAAIVFPASSIGGYDYVQATIFWGAGTTAGEVFGVASIQ